MHAQRSKICVQAVHVYRLAHASIHVFPAHAPLISAHASLIFVDVFSMVLMEKRHGDVMYLRDSTNESV